MKKARAENFITRFARVYTPAVCYGALALAFLPPIVLLLMGQPARFGDWIYRALTFLVISLPLRAGHLHPAELLRRHRRRFRLRHPRQGLHLSGRAGPYRCGGL